MAVPMTRSRSPRRRPFLIADPARHAAWKEQRRQRGCSRVGAQASPVGSPAAAEGLAAAPAGEPEAVAPKASEVCPAGKHKGKTYQMIFDAEPLYAKMMLKNKVAPSLAVVTWLLTQAAAREPKRAEGAAGDGTSGEGSERKPTPILERWRGQLDNGAYDFLAKSPAGVQEEVLQELERKGDEVRNPSAFVTRACLKRLQDKEAHLSAGDESSLGAEKIPERASPAAAAKRRVMVTVPLRVSAKTKSTIGVLRQRLLQGGLKVSEGSFRCQGSAEALQDNDRIDALSDKRLIFSPDPGLTPLQSAAARDQMQRLVAAQAAKGSGLDQATIRNLFYKTRLCKAWTASGSCSRGDACLYAHGPEEKRQSLKPAELLSLGLRPNGSWVAGKTGPKEQPSKESRQEVLYTVDPVEEKKRAERAKRFSTRLASFEVDKEGSAEPESLHAATTGAEVSGDLVNLEDYLVQMERLAFGSLYQGGGDPDEGQQGASAGLGQESAEEAPPGGSPSPGHEAEAGGDVS